MSAPGRARIAYRRRASPLHAARGTVVGAYCASIALAALLTEHPLLLASLLATVLCAGAAAGDGPQLLRALRRSALPLIGLSVVVNLLVSRQGLTVFARLGDWGVLGQVNLTLEALVYGAVFALRLLVVGLACLLAVCAADPDQLLGSCRRLSPRVALSATLALRLVPVLAADAGRLAEAQRCRPGARARNPGTRERLAVLRATVAGALERSLDVAAVLEMRGYPSPRRAPRRLGPRSRHDLAFAASAGTITLLALCCSLAGAAHFAAYPLVSAPLDPAVVALALALPALALAPFLDRSGIEP
jgi:energy-coupling factor transport system permease protein